MKGGTVMMDTGSLTSELMWRAALVAALIDTPLLFLVARGVSSGLFGELKWYLAGAGFVVYAALWGSYGSLLYWDAVYHAIFPDWFRWFLPLIFGVLFGVLALVFWWVGRRAARWQAVWFCLLGGLFSLVGHAIGISRGLMRVPMLAGTSAASALVFGVFEFTFYWCAMVGLGLTARWLVRRMHRLQRN